MFARMFRRLRHWLRYSSHFHIVEPVGTLLDVVGVIDRFLDGTPRYALEWDDFVSWEHVNPNIERIRDAIAETEPLFFSGKMEDKLQGLEIVLSQRNRAAALAGLPIRE